MSGDEPWRRLLDAGACARGGHEMKQSISRFVLLAMVAAAVASVVASESPGRYKKQGDSCVWDANDSGPNQCVPQTEGRFKKDGDKCVWAAGDLGPDQCTPPMGRFKTEGNRCVWDANDSGPNQCNPKKPK
jgi:hypothetical protein